MEGPLINNTTRCGKVNKVKSKDWKNGPKDMLQFTIRVKE